MSRVHCEISQSNLCQYWERLSHELMAVRKLREASLLYNMQLLQLLQVIPVCRVTSDSNQVLFKRFPTFLSCSVKLFITSHHVTSQV